MIKIIIVYIVLVYIFLCFKFIILISYIAANQGLN